MGGVCSTEASTYSHIEGTEDPQAVILHIYSLGSSKSADIANKVFRKFGTGAFHCGIEVHGSEYSFSTQIWSSRLGKGSGVFRVPPRRAVGHCYMESIFLGVTAHPDHHVDAILHRLAEEWPASKYDTLRKNCHHFCIKLCEQLGVDSLPKWVTSLPEVGESLVYPTAVCCQGDLSPPSSDALYITVLDESIEVPKSMSPLAASESTSASINSPRLLTSGRFSSSRRSSSTSDPSGRLSSDMQESCSDTGTTIGDVVTSSHTSD